ncbi:MAG: MBG domain-containing protein, partial [Methylococcales bacterium]|nr:MBG domain-containing protein [Methylococcales bacterium]
MKIKNRLFSTHPNLRHHALHLAIMAILYPSVSPANPTGAQVVSGQVSIDQSVAGITTITNTPSAIINWQDFNIAQHEITRFIQQNGQSAVLNRIIGGNPSEILGSLFSNGQVFLINPNGIVFGAGSQIDTQGLIASSLNLSDSDFQKGNFHFIAGSKAGDISNEGIIHAGKDGNIVLIAPNIENKGIIQSDGGKITLAAGQELILTSMDDPDIRFQVQAPKNQVLNIGQLLTEGGAINVFAGSIKHSGDINADSVEIDKQGNIRLVAKENITLDKNSTISANNAKGDGGNVAVLSDNNTNVSGSISAKSGANSGNGGFVETSGKELNIADTARVDTSAPHGKSGTWLLDPVNFTIAEEDGNAKSSTIATALESSSLVEISTTGTGAAVGNITVDAIIKKTAGADSTLQLKANNAVIINPDVAIESTAGKLNIVLNADTDSSNGGNVQIKSGASLNSNGGNIVMGGGTCDTSSCSAPAKGYGFDSNGDEQDEGIAITTASINSNGGAINLKGEGFSGSGLSNSHGVFLDEATINGGAGNVTINGTGGVGTAVQGQHGNSNQFGDLIGGDNNNGVFFTGHNGSHVSRTKHLSSISTTTGMINITGEGRGNGQSNFGISSDSAMMVNTTSGGSIMLRGTGANNDAGILLDSDTQIGNPTSGNVTLITTNAVPMTSDSLIFANTLSNGVNPIIQSAGNLTLNATGTILQNATFSVTGLNLLGSAHYYLNKPSNTISALTASGINSLHFLNNGELNIGGIIARDAVVVETSGNINVNQKVESSAITLNSTAGNIALAGNFISTSGQAILNTNTIAGSAGLSNSVPAGHFRYNNVAVDSTATGIYAIYREQPMLTITANSFSKSYDGVAYSGGNGVTTTGFFNGDTAAILNGTLVYGGNSQGAINQGSYTITANGYTNSIGYGIQFINGTLSIDPALLSVMTLTADNKTRVYGDSNPTFTGSISSGSLKAGDTLASIGLSFTTPATVLSNVGSYAIVPSITSTNYAFTGINGVLSITPRLLNIAAISQTKVYGESDLPLTYNASGLVNGDLLTGTVTRVTGENVGNYLINKGTLAASSNYELTFTGGDFKITPANLTIAANAQTKIYGAVDPVLSFSAAGFKLNDKIDLITGSLSRGAGKNVGKYAIEKGSLTAGGNYTLAFTGNNLEIAPRTLNVIAQATNKIYDGTTLATPRFTDDRIVGDALQIDAAANFDTKNVGTAKTV